MKTTKVIAIAFSVILCCTLVLSIYTRSFAQEYLPQPPCLSTEVQYGSTMAAYTELVNCPSCSANGPVREGDYLVTTFTSIPNWTQRQSCRGDEDLTKTCIDTWAGAYNPAPCSTIREYSPEEVDSDDTGTNSDSTGTEETGTEGTGTGTN